MYLLVLKLKGIFNMNLKKIIGKISKIAYGKTGHEKFKGIKDNHPNIFSCN